MPKLSAFPSVSRGWIDTTARISLDAVREGITAGATYMRLAIDDRPTGTKWHRDKNDANPGFGQGARIGNNNPDFGTEGVDPNSGLMLASVSSAGPSSTGGNIKGSYGWLDVQKDYFLLQDVGNYGVGNQSGMGLINIAMNPTAAVEQMGAVMKAESAVAKVMLAAGFKYTGSAF
jgi:hypothetical protein